MNGDSFSMARIQPIKRAFDDMRTQVENRANT